MKRIILILFFILAGVWLYADAQGKRSAQPARPARPQRIDYSRFKHSSHAGALKASRKGAVQQLDCAYCHGTPAKDSPDVVRGYPYRKYGLKSELTHSACSDCHAITGREAIATDTFPAMCLICHQTATFARMGRNLRTFPNPAAAASQFFDRYAHLEHTVYFEASSTFKERFKDKEKFKEENHFECVACHTPNQEKIVASKIEFDPGARESRPSHPECFVCHFNEKEVPKEKTAFATNCVGCHTLTAEQDGKGSELAVHWLRRQIVNPEKNPLKTRSGEEALKPFSHKSHEDDDDKSTRKCLECHVTAKRAVRRSDFFLEDSEETREKQPRAAGCIQCHNSEGEMQRKIEGAVTLETSKCSYCHSLPTLKERAAGGAQLPPPSHFGPKAPSAPTPKPESKPELGRFTFFSLSQRTR